MSDPDFERRLSRMFAETPVQPDAVLFASEIENRLSRGWALRRVLIGAAGAVGGLIAVMQVAGASLGQRIAQAGDLLDSARHTLSQTPEHLPQPLAQPLSQIGQLPFGGEAIWMVVGLAVLAGALLASRSLEEI